MRVFGDVSRGPATTLAAVLGVLIVCSSAGAETTTFLGGEGSPRQFVVPEGVTSIQVTAVGASGQAGAGCQGVGSGGGGSGARVTGTLATTPGEILDVDFGGEGNGAVTQECGSGGAGGGYSDVRAAPGSLASRLIVAGGGGGGGASVGARLEEETYFGGAGESGVDTRSSYEKETEDRATQVLGELFLPMASGGAGSSAGVGVRGECPGTNGSNGAGGSALYEVGVCGGGGGGGGGYVGGGGGGGGHDEVEYMRAKFQFAMGGGGGGAGSSYYEGAGVSAGKLESGAGEAQHVSLTYTIRIAPPTATIKAPGNDHTYALGKHVATKFSCTESTHGPGLESCRDSNGASSPSGVLDTKSIGLFRYTVTATSSDREAGEAQIAYAVDTTEKKVYDYCGEGLVGCFNEFIVDAASKTWELPAYEISGAIEEVKVGKSKMTDFRVTSKLGAGCVLFSTKTKTGYNSQAQRGVFECPSSGVIEHWYASKL